MRNWNVASMPAIQNCSTFYDRDKEVETGCYISNVPEVAVMRRGLLLLAALHIIENGKKRASEVPTPASVDPGGTGFETETGKNAVQADKVLPEIERFSLRRNGTPFIFHRGLVKRLCQGALKLQDLHAADVSAMQHDIKYLNATQLLAIRLNNLNTLSSQHFETHCCFLHQLDVQLSEQIGETLLSFLHTNDSSQDAVRSQLGSGDSFEDCADQVCHGVSKVMLKPYHPSAFEASQEVREASKPPTTETLLQPRFLIGLDGRSPTVAHAILSSSSASASSTKGLSPSSREAPKSPQEARNFDIKRLIARFDSRRQVDREAAPQQKTQETSPSSKGRKVGPEFRRSHTVPGVEHLSWASTAFIKTARLSMPLVTAFCNMKQRHSFRTESTAYVSEGKTTQREADKQHEASPKRTLASSQASSDLLDNSVHNPLDWNTAGPSSGSLSHTSETSTLCKGSQTVPLFGRSAGRPPVANASPIRKVQKIQPPLSQKALSNKLEKRLLGRDLILCLGIAAEACHRKPNLFSCIRQHTVDLIGTSAHFDTRGCHLQTDKAMGDLEASNAKKHTDASPASEFGGLTGFWWRIAVRSRAGAPPSRAPASSADLSVCSLSLPRRKESGVGGLVSTSCETVPSSTVDCYRNAAVPSLDTSWRSRSFVANRNSECVAYAQSTWVELFVWIDGTSTIRVQKTRPEGEPVWLYAQHGGDTSQSGALNWSLLKVPSHVSFESVSWGNTQQNVMDELKWRLGIS